MSSPKALGLVALLVLACEATTSSPPSPRSNAPTPPDDAIAAAEPSADGQPIPPAATPPPEPPWPQAAGLAYREMVLGTDDVDAPLPMVVAIHGLGDTPDNFVHLLDDFPEPVRVILPRGLEPTEDGGYSWFPLRARDPDVTALSAGVEHAADRIAEGLQELQRLRPTVGKPIVTGFSQGGILTFTLAVHHPEVVGHAVVVGGWLPPPLVPEARTPETEYPPIHALHGTTDAAVFYEPTAAAVAAVKALGLKAELTSYEGVGHMIPPPMRRDLYDRLIDAVHAELERPKP